MLTRRGLLLAGDDLLSPLDSLGLNSNRNSAVANPREYGDGTRRNRSRVLGLWPGRNYAGGGEWRGGLDWDKRMDYESFYRRRFRAAAEAIGRPTLWFHDLRHTAASLWAASGMPLEMVAATLGHADTGVTYKTYLHFFPDQCARYMAGMDAFLAAPDVHVTPLRRAEA